MWLHGGVKSGGRSPRSALAFGLVALAVAVASIVLMIVNGPSTSRILVLVAMVLVMLSQVLAVVRYRRSSLGR